MQWTEAILEILQRHGGATTLASMYAEIPKLVAKTSTQDVEKAVRSCLDLLVHGRGKIRQQRIKRIGLATYALMDYKADNNLFDDIKNDRIEEKSFASLPETKLHGYLQGILVEIGNMKNFQTYTPDKNVVLNGKKLSEIASLPTIPQFTYADRLDIIRQIDVIWFRDGYPVQTFDVENSTNFTSAFLRCYQLKYFKTKCCMVADKKKENTFNKRIATKPFDEIKDNVVLVENSFVFQTYKQMMNLHELKKQNPIL